MLVRDMDLAPGANHMADGRRLEVVVDGFSLFQGAQLAIDTTLVSAVRAAEHRGPVQPGKEALPWMTRGHGKRSRIRSLSARAVVPSLSFSRRKEADVGLPRRHSSSARLQHQKQFRRQSSCKRPWRMHGATGGGGCWVFRGESFRWLFVGTSLSRLSCRSGPVGARCDSGWPS